MARWNTSLQTVWRFVRSETSKSIPVSLAGTHRLTCRNFLWMLGPG